MATVLLATLGESPVVITSMVDKLDEAAKKNQITPVDILEIVYTKATLVEDGYYWMAGELKAKYNLDPHLVELDFEDTNSEAYSYAFLHTLNECLESHLYAGDTVYLSLAGGRKNTSALMALLAPLYPCVKKLYHVLNTDKYSDSFSSMRNLSKLSEANQHKAMFPDRKKVILVDIPYDEEQQVSPSFLERLRTLTDEQLDDLWELDPDEAESFSFARNPRLLSLEITPDAAKQYQKFEKKDTNRARKFFASFQQMRYISRLSKVAGKGEVGSHGGFSHTWKDKSFTFHFYKRINEIRPFYHTEPEDIQGRPDGHATKVIISHLEIEREDEYASGNDIIQSLDFPIKSQPLEKMIFQEKKRKSILLVSLGTTPMIATQLYALLLQQRYQIQRVVLLSPDPMESSEIDRSCTLAQKAFKVKGVPHELRTLNGYGDIDSPEACVAYQRKLEDTIKDLQDRYPGYQVELALGGRKVMAALAVFAAQNTGIRHVHHTLITDDNFEQRVLEQTSLESLEKLPKDVLVNRLFLDAYKDELKDNKFVAFQVPVIPSRKWSAASSNAGNR